MTIAISGSGARYVGGGLEWWTKGRGSGSEGTLFRHEEYHRRSNREVCSGEYWMKVQRGYGGYGIVINGSEY